MSRKMEYPVPDLIDVTNVQQELGEAYGLTVQYQVEVRVDYITVIGRAYKHAGTVDPVLQFQALVKKPLHTHVDIAQLLFTVCFDLFAQADGGGATSAARGAPRGWNGRPQVRARSRK